MRADHDAVQAAIAELMRTPVGRRWLLKAGLTAVAAGTVGPTVSGCGDSSSAPNAVQSGDIHFALGAAATHDDLRVVVNGQRVALTPHSDRSRSSLRSLGTLWAKVDTSALTHFATVSLPTDRGLPLSVYGTRRGTTVVVAQSFHAPEPAIRALAITAYALQGHYGSVAGSPERLATLGLDVSMLESEDEIVDLDRLCDAHSTAINLVMLHPNVATINSAAVAATKSLLGQTPAVGALGSYIGQMQRAGQDWATLVPAVDGNGKPSQIRIGKPGTATTTFSTIRLNGTDQTFAANTRAAVGAAIAGVRDTGDLGTVLDQPLDESPGDTSTWHQAAGVVPTPVPYVPPGGVGAGVDVRIADEKLLFGTYTARNGDYAGGKLPLKLYNNYVRWVWVYVQYLKADGTNLSLSDSATFPDTQHAQSLGLLPQVFTVLGVPLWDTNTIEVTLDFPPEATSARLLFCGLGSELVGGGWRQYFPADAYPDAAAPHDEVIVAGILTGIVSLGLTTFALATDLDIATVWAEYRKVLSASELSDSDSFYRDLVLPLIEAGKALSAAEAFAAAVATGAATYEEVQARNAALTNLWSILVSFGTVIPKMIFNPELVQGLWTTLAIQLGALEAANKMLEAVPLIGQVVAVLEAAGDVATLAEAIGETVASPWVIANQVSLTYQATVTVSRDGRAATWPVTARSWRLEAQIDGAVALAPITGPLNAGGSTQSDPITIEVTAPFGGNAITWSFVALDAGGNQVGTGVSGKLANDDQADPPASVAFAITELPAAITAATVFRRADTTSYDSAGYTWSDAITDDGTNRSGEIQEIAGVAIATRLGVVGIVWKQGDKYWLRGVPVAENGNAITLGGATRQGYARRPFLLLDAFVGDGDAANHVLLEPDDTAPGYHVRRLAIAAATGELSWDPSASLGYFALPVSAAALHSSGRVVAVHTDSGRLGHVLPAATPRPPLGTYVAGPGTQIGLLSSPTAVAITNPGVVIVLEAAAAQLSAFDLNGNPLRYFGGGSPAAFTLALSNEVTYLDVAVDGAGQIYLLSHAGDGSEPAQYRVDVYTATGDPLATNSPGTNVPRLAVDYWRSIYAANFTALRDRASGQPRIDPALGVAEPSLSRFDPTT